MTEAANPAVCPHCGGQGAHHPMPDMRPCPEAAGSAWPYRTTRPKAIGVKKPYAVITSGSRYSSPRTKSPATWTVYLIGRESETRIYKAAQKPARWAHDGYKTKKHDVLERFDTEAEAQAFIDAALKVMAEPLEALKIAEERERAASHTAGQARQTLHAAVTNFWSAHLNP
ncbi:hypothetical protein UFOVP1324_42 [uncultured Caudovirales phage]|uniref:Uncharacterized protein n=1 Tax=uncultured Caudovirales phage TaxID=2100421 RepID=A0A6J5S1B0_9CAUD|nr:hypothetical protein UFOVP1324_42 [uncultured Caudovirales phage]